MNYLNAIEILTNIEKKYDVMSVKLDGISIWPYLRCYLVDMLGYNKARKASFSNALYIIKNLFRYNPFSIRKKMDIWSYSGMITRKRVGDKYIHHVSGVLPEITNKVLYFENPEMTKPHLPLKSIPEKYIISNAWSIFLSRMMEYALRLRTIRIENEAIMDQINHDYKIQYNYKFRTRLLLGQKIATNILLFFGKKPKAVVMECPYNQMGYVWSFHNHDIPVIELQHGVLNDNHYAYNSIYYGGILAPDSICVYGDQEYEYLINRKTPFCKKVFKTGLFILESVDKFFKKDPFKDLRTKFKGFIVVAGQTDCEQELLKFIDSCASLTKQYMYFYVPRRSGDLESMETNVHILNNVNIYEYLKWCDIHCTVSSTTCLEAQYFSTPNIFIELNDTARNYYGQILTEDNGSFFCSNKNDFKQLIDYISMNQNKFKYKNLFAKDTTYRVKKVLENYNLY